METESKRMHITLSLEQLDKIDDYRKDIPGIPDRTNAIRQLIELGYEAYRREKEGKED
jgi:metal-responsive CopG/Arc/MetJ family transcriptional regulator